MTPHRKRSTAQAGIETRSAALKADKAAYKRENCVADNFLNSIELCTSLPISIAVEARQGITDMSLREETCVQAIMKWQAIVHSTKFQILMYNCMYTQ